MKDFLNFPALLNFLFWLLTTPTHYAWAVLIVLGLWALSKVFASLTELIKVFK